MQKREIAWIVALFVLIGAYIHYFSHWGGKREIQVAATLRPILPTPRRGGATANAPAFRLLFSLDIYYRLNSIEVTAVDSPDTNAANHVFWHLVSKTGSHPLKWFQYGQDIEGMEPDLKGVQPEPLVPGDKYRMEVTAGKLRGASLPFTIPANPK